MDILIILNFHYYRIFYCKRWASLVAQVVKNAAAAAAKSLQLCPTLCDPTDGSPPGSPVPGILQARTLESVCRGYAPSFQGSVGSSEVSSGLILSLRLF